ncbi:MAG: kynureninase [Gemmataceae bacterium]
MGDWGPSKESFALDLDAADPLRNFRTDFHYLPLTQKNAGVYFCGHSLGLKPLKANEYVQSELNAWSWHGVEGHFKGPHPWYSYHEQFAEPGARLVGALPSEVVFMNSLTVNLHLMLATFYRPTSRRAGILIDEPSFPSDRYAIESVIRNHGYDPEEWLFATDEPERVLETRGEQIQVCVLNAVNFLTGKFCNVPALHAQAYSAGCIFGLDLAHAIGNVPLQLHDWNVDFAVWCSYKYLNSGPGAVGGCFVHQKHGENTALPRLAGWWGNDPATRFRMHLEPTFVPKPGADGWQLSNPPILAMAPIRASLELFDKAGMNRLRAKSEQLTNYLEMLLDRLPAGRITPLTPREPNRRGCMLALRITGDAQKLHQYLESRGIVCDFRPPDVIRVAPVPLYNSFHDVWRFVHALSEVL